MKRLPYLVVLVLGICLACRLPCRAQDHHFSQFFASPLTLNPAFTGLFQGDLRLAANYRNQWYTIATPFVTGTVSADFDILRNTVAYNDRWGVGLLALYDQTGGGGLKATYLGISTAYHKGLDAEGLKSLALGFQAAFSQKRLDFPKLVFENQLTNQGFDQSLPNGEYFPNSMVSHADFNIGALYNVSVGEFGNYYAGASYYHITSPNESFLGAQYPIHSRLALHGGGGFAPTPLTRVYLSGQYMQQAGAREITGGGAFGFVINNRPYDADLFYVGAWYRWDDAINPYVGVELGGLHIGLSYDVNVSTLHQASEYKGGAEVSFIYTWSRADPNRKKVNCPRF